MVGILGGTFDPIHLGHLKMAESVRRKLNIRRMLFIPVGDPPHKGELTSARDRLEMVRLAVAGRLGFEACDLEVKRPGVTYTIDTLKELKRLYPDDAWCYIVGADTLAVIETWRTFDRVAAELAMLAVVPREGIDAPSLASQARMIAEKYRLDVRVMSETVSPVTSTEIRHLAARHKSLEGLVPEAVERYIRAHKLYRDPMIEELRRTMTPARFRHTLGVEQTAVRLAEHLGVDPERARTAALLHDCAKYLSVDEMQRQVDAANIPLAAGEGESRALLHAAAGMALARSHYGVTDEDILSAIRWHTTGRAGMTTLDKVIYLADMIEPNRRPFPDIERIREAAWRDLDEAMGIAARRTVDYVRSRGMPLNERTLELLECMEEKKM